MSTTAEGRVPGSDARGCPGVLSLPGVVGFPRDALLTRNIHKTSADPSRREARRSALTQ